MRRSFYIIFFNLCLSASAQDLQYVFKPGDNAYKCFRIPAIVRTNSGTLLAFAEARKNGCGDTGDIDLVMRRSVDNGKTWSAIQIVWNDGGNTCGNPAPVVDKRTGKILPSDDGATWSSAREITTDVKLKDWTWYATGPVNGVQVQNGKFKNRLIIPCDHIEAGTKKYYSHTIHSDDGGETWKLGGSTPTDQVNESTVAEIKKGRLLLNMRNYNQLRVRQTSISSDGGETWSALRPDTSLIEPICQASLLRLENKKKTILAFSNPAHAKQRVGMTVRLSYDQGKTWAREKVLWEGPSAYSNLVLLSDGRLACLFEGGVKTAYEGIAFSIVLLATGL